MSSLCLSDFRALSDKWWDPNGPLSGLHSMNTLRVPFIREGLVQTGAATGTLAEPLNGLVRCNSWMKVQQ